MRIRTAKASMAGNCRQPRGKSRRKWAPGRPFAPTGFKKSLMYVI